MKSFLAALLFAAVLSPAVANAGSGWCQTSCYWIGDQQFCEERCW